jgi:hypothetical protein
MSVLTDRVEVLLQRWAKRGLFVDTQARLELHQLVQGVARSRVQVAPLVAALEQAFKMDNGSQRLADVVHAHLENGDLPPPVCTGTGHRAAEPAYAVGRGGCGICGNSRVPMDGVGALLPHPYSSPVDRR